MYRRMTYWRMTYRRMTYWVWRTDVWRTDVWRTNVWRTDVWRTDVWHTDVLMYGVLTHICCEKIHNAILRQFQMKFITYTDTCHHFLCPVEKQQTCPCSSANSNCGCHETLNLILVFKFFLLGDCCSCKVSPPVTFVLKNIFYPVSAQQLSSFLTENTPCFYYVRQCLWCQSYVPKNKLTTQAKTASLKCCVM
jgi:hypothetical protein